MSAESVCAPHPDYPVFLYHRVMQKYTHDPFGICVQADYLESQLRYLCLKHIPTLTFDDLERNVDCKPQGVVLTFDDGYKDNYELLLPLLEKYRAKAVIYVLANRKLGFNEWRGPGVPIAALMDDTMLRKCVASGLVEIGSHGWNHRDLTLVSDSELKKEIIDSRNTLADLLGCEIHSFAYPGGAWGIRERNMVQVAGYKYGVAVNTKARHGFSDRYAIRRRGINQKTQHIEFKIKLSKRYFMWSDLAKSVPGRK